MIRPEMISPRRGDRVADCAGLENQCAQAYPGFESLPLRLFQSTFRNQMQLRMLRRVPRFVPMTETDTGTDRTFLTLCRRSRQTPQFLNFVLITRIID